MASDQWTAASMDAGQLQDEAKAAVSHSGVHDKFKRRDKSVAVKQTKVLAPL